MAIENCNIHDTPEACVSISDNLPAGYPLDAMYCALGRLNAILAVLSCQFDGSGGNGEPLSEIHMTNLIWAAEGQAATLKSLIEHGATTQNEHLKPAPPAVLLFNEGAKKEAQDNLGDILFAVSNIGSLLEMSGAKAAGFDGINDDQAAALGIAVRLLIDQLGSSGIIQ